MAHTEDRWLKDGQKTSLYGKGMRYRVRYIDPAGVERSKSFPDKQKKAADAFKADVESKINHGEYIDPNAGKVTFKEYADNWLTQCTAGEGSVATYERSLRLKVYPELGNRALNAISTAGIRAWLAELKRQNVAPTYIRDVKALVSTILHAAVEDGLIARNPCVSKTTKTPKIATQPVVPWSLKAVLDIRDALPDRYKAMVELAAGCGLRQGEIFGLAVDDIDEEAGLLHVRRQIKLLRNRQVFDLPKHQKTRDVPLPEYVLAALKAHMRSFTPIAVTLPWQTLDGKLRTADLVFTTVNWNPLKRNTFNEDVWSRARQVAGIKADRSNGMHALRHFYVSVSLHGGVSIKAVSKYVGHEDPAFTLRIYAHLMPESPATSRAAVNAAFGYVPSPSDGLVTA